MCFVPGKLVRANFAVVGLVEALVRLNQAMRVISEVVALLLHRSVLKRGTNQKAVLAQLPIPLPASAKKDQPNMLASDSVLLAQLSATSWLEIFGALFLGLVALVLLKLGPKQFLFFLSRPYDTFGLVKYVAFARARVPKDISPDMKW